MVVPWRWGVEHTHRGSVGTMWKRNYYDSQLNEDEHVHLYRYGGNAFSSLPSRSLASRRVLLDISFPILLWAVLSSTFLRSTCTTRQGWETLRVSCMYTAIPKGSGEREHLCLRLLLTLLRHDPCLCPLEPTNTLFSPHRSIVVLTPYNAGHSPLPGDNVLS